MFPKQAANSLVTETLQYFVFFCRSVYYAIFAKCLIINVLRLIRTILFFIAFLNITYAARHTWPKEDIDAHNRKTRHSGGYKILRYRNSTENDFSRLLYNYDAVRMDETDTVILAEGIFDVIALTRRLELYDNSHVAAVATFGKKISDVQIYKLQSKGVRTVVIGYDGDAVESVKRTAERLKPYFEVFIADIADAAKDWDELTEAEIYGIFACRLLSVLEYKLKKVQER